MFVERNTHMGCVTKLASQTTASHPCRAYVCMICTMFLGSKARVGPIHEST